MIQTWGKDAWQSLPESALRRLQATKLRRYLRDVVVPFSPHYRELFAKNKIDPDSIRTLDDLRRIPFTSKADLLGTVREFVLTPDRKQLARRPSTILRALVMGRDRVARGFEREFRPTLMTSTTGRSAEPVPFFYTAHDIAAMETAGERVMQVCCADREMRMMNVFPFAPHLAFWVTHYSGTKFGVFMLSTGGGKTLGTDGNLRLVKKIQPDVIIGMPTFIYHLLNEAAVGGVRCPNLSKLVLGGEKVPTGIRRKLRAMARELGATKVDVLATYGFTEAKMAFPECPFPEDGTSGGYHIFPDLGIVEIVDPKTGEPVPNGSPGEIVFTPLEARGSVVLRYRTGDCIEGGIVFYKCPHCGRCCPRLVGRISRRSDVKEMRLEKLKGTLVDFNQLEHVLDNTGHVGAWQLEIRKRHDDPLELDELILHVEKRGHVGDAQLRDELNRRFADETEVHPNKILFHSVDELRRMLGIGTKLKEERVVDNRPKTDAALAAQTQT